VSDVTLDHGRRDRIGFDEAILCAGKSTDQLKRVLDAAGADGTLLLTRLEADALAALGTGDAIDYDRVSRTGYYGTVAVPETGPRIAVITAGTSDIPVAREAARTLSYYGAASSEFADIGVAGLWRLEERLQEIRDHPIAIVIAGMDGAIASVLGGLYGGAMIVVPTSTGYGAARGGETALSSALASCAPGLTVVNIDNGYGAACAALRILRCLA
jgi:NCAIR mutase (PurE)-related protein